MRKMKYLQKILSEQYFNVWKLVWFQTFVKNYSIHRRKKITVKTLLTIQSLLSQSLVSSISTNRSSMKLLCTQNSICNSLIQKRLSHTSSSDDDDVKSKILFISKNNLDWLEKFFNFGNAQLSLVPLSEFSQNFQSIKNFEALQMTGFIGNKIHNETNNDSKGKTEQNEQDKQLLDILEKYSIKQFPKTASINKKAYVPILLIDNLEDALEIPKDQNTFEELNEPDLIRQISVNSVANNDSDAMNHKEFMNNSYRNFLHTKEPLNHVYYEKLKDFNKDETFESSDKNISLPIQRDESSFMEEQIVPIKFEVQVNGIIGIDAKQYNIDSLENKELISNRNLSALIMMLAGNACNRELHQNLKQIKGISPPMVQFSTKSTSNTDCTIDENFCSPGNLFQTYKATIVKLTTDCITKPEIQQERNFHQKIENQAKHIQIDTKIEEVKQGQLSNQDSVVKLSDNVYKKIEEKSNRSLENQTNHVEIRTQLQKSKSTKPVIPRVNVLKSLPKCVISKPVHQNKIESVNGSLKHNASSSKMYNSCSSVIKPPATASNQNPKSTLLQPVNTERSQLQKIENKVHQKVCNDPVRTDKNSNSFEKPMKTQEKEESNINEKFSKSNPVKEISENDELQQKNLLKEHQNPIKQETLEQKSIKYQEIKEAQVKSSKSKDNFKCDKPITTEISLKSTQEISKINSEVSDVKIYGGTPKQDNKWPTPICGKSKQKPVADQKESLNLSQTLENESVKPASKSNSDSLCGSVPQKQSEKPNNKLSAQSDSKVNKQNTSEPISQVNSASKSSYDSLCGLVSQKQNEKPNDKLSDSKVNKQKCVTDLQVGDRVTIEPGVCCGLCDFCKIGKYNLCPNTIYIRSMSNYTIHPCDFCHKISRKMDLEEAALVHPVALAIHACMKAKLNPRSCVLVIGSCPLALSTVMCARALNVSHVTIVDTVDKNLQIASEHGADYTIKIKSQMSTNEITEYILAKTKHRPNVIIIVSGCMKTFQIACQCCDYNGKIILAGCHEKYGKIDCLQTLTKELQILSSYRSCNDYPIAIKLIERGLVKPSKFITHRFSLAQIQKAFNTILDPKQEVIKAVIKCQDFSDKNYQSLI